MTAEAFGTEYSGLHVTNADEQIRFVESVGVSEIGRQSLTQAPFVV